MSQPVFFNKSVFVFMEFLSYFYTLRIQHFDFVDQSLFDCLEGRQDYDNPEHSSATEELG